MDRSLPFPSGQDGSSVNASWWWIDRWRKSTAYTDMTAEEQGLYRNLLDEVWLRDDYIIPDDPRILAKASGDHEAWSRSGAVVLRHMKRVKGGWTNETALEVIGQSERRKRNQQAYRDRKRGASDNAPDNGADNASGNDPDNKPASPSPSPSPISGTVSDTDTEEAAVPATASKASFRKAAMAFCPIGSLLYFVWEGWVDHLCAFPASKRPPLSTVRSQYGKLRNAGPQVAKAAIEYLVDCGKATVSPRVIEVARDKLNGVAADGTKPDADVDQIMREMR